MDLITLVLFGIVYAISIIFPLVLLPKMLDARGDLPYNSVASRLLAWSSFAALMVAISALGPVGALAWDLNQWGVFLAAIAVAAAWDIYDLKTRRIPRGRHPDR